MSRRHSLVVGGTRGIGRAVVRAFVAEGRLCSVIGRRPPAASDGPDVRCWTTDITDREAFRGALREIVATRGKLTSLVFLQRYRGDGDAWAGEIEVALAASRHAIECLADEFDPAGQGSIVIVSSVAARLIADDQGPGYHVAKAGLNQLVRYYAVKLGPKNIRVNGVSPFMVLKEESRDFYLRNEPLQTLFRTATPLGRMGTAEEVAQVVSFLSGPGASFVTGQDIAVDGGLSIVSQESIARRFVPLPKRPPEAK